MNTINQYSNHNPFYPKQSDGEIMLIALFGGMLLCLGIVVGSNLLNSFLENDSFDDYIFRCSFGSEDKDLEEEKLANTINATYIVSFNELDYVPLEEIPLGFNDEGPHVKTYNQLPADITQEGFVDGNIIVYEPIEVADVSEYVEECRLTGLVISTAEEDRTILHEEGCVRITTLYSESAKPYEGEEDFTTNLMNILNLDNYLNSGEQYRFDVNFTVNRYGYLVDIVVVGTQGYLPSHVKKRIVQKIQTLPQWKPATQNSRSVAMKFKLPIVVNVQ
ncbi:hypothetical protein HX017_17490 [Myroides marinus]|uniref:hypothetical protein n=1 Tax=Myroides marinus TaxID=703342 RepID=UPI002577AB26|nr:hypothetical protein [Myroides marinus]MDM1346817.1 hypothetical protein [Myroides marinus]MDM1352409.1 hypothetical protein [Myroides marinus]MDM1359614.1 hypothetical protein [Myroides marinus]MDM1361464.1 hypothetical protein [Myroides marinus]MDM1366725.1 hypothetical protein [Myroides marinus]